MAQCIPDKLPTNGSKGEQRLFSILSGLPDDCLVYYEPIIENRFADFVVLIPMLGLMVVEVKGWYPNDIVGGDLENVTVSMRGIDQVHRHPIRQAREYMTALMGRCERHKAFKSLLHEHGQYKGRFIFPFGYFSILSNATQAQIEEAGKAVLFPKEKVMTRDEFLEWEKSSPETSLAVLKSYFDPWWPLVAPLTPTQIDTLRAIIHPEVMLFSFMEEKKGKDEETIKVLDLRQENHSRNIGSGHRIIYGVAGSGKTVILVSRAKLLASSNPAKQHLFLCYNIALALHLRFLLKDHTNVVIRHFDGWSIDQGFRRKEHEDNDSLGGRLLGSLKSGGGDARKYSSVFVDEAQDFAASWFSCALEAMQDPLDGDLLIVGDGNQGVYHQRDFTWASVGIQAVGRTINTKFDLDRCYRSTKEIMTLAQSFASACKEQAEVAITSMQIDPEQCTRASGFRPVIMGCNSLEEECQYAAAVTKELLVGKWFGRDIPTPLQSSEIGILYRNAGWDVNKLLLDQLEKQIGTAIWLSRSREAMQMLTEPGVKIQTIHSAKGLQYKAVILLWAGQMPSTKENDDPERERRLMFVGLTRAEEYLTILHSHASSFVQEIVGAGAAENLLDQ